MRTRAFQSHSVNQRKVSTLGSDGFLLDIVPPSPYHAADVIRARSQPSNQHDAVTDRDNVVRLPPPPSDLVRDRASTATLGDSVRSTRRPMTPQSPPPRLPSASNSLSSDVYSSGVTNAAFIHLDPVRVEYATADGSRRVSGVRPLNGQRTPHATASTINGVSRSPAIPRRRDVDIGDCHRPTTGVCGSRPRGDEYVHSHPPPPPLLAASGSTAGATGHQNSAVLVGATDDDHPAGLRGPLSMSTGVLNFSPPAPHLTPNQVRSLTLSLSLSVTR